MTTRMYKGFSITLATALLIAVAVAPASAQLTAGPFTAFPSEDVTDAKFLSAVSGFAGLSDQTTSVGLSVPVDKAGGTFLFRMFDGDTGDPCVLDWPSVDATCFAPTQGHWDEGTRAIRVRMFEDPTRIGNTNPADMVGEWFGNEDNPLADPAGVWTASPARMPNNDFWDVFVEIDGDGDGNPDAALPGSDTAFYNVVIDLKDAPECDVDPAPAGCEGVSNYKVFADVPLAVFSAQFGFEGGFGLGNNEQLVVYPTLAEFILNNPGVPFDHQNAPTTYDGMYAFFLDVPFNIQALRIWDGDFDHGNSLTASGVAEACSDTDDFNSSGIPPFAGPDAVAEGAQGAGNPEDDSTNPVVLRSPCVRYAVRGPNANVYDNDNPSGQREWEQFLISTDAADNPDHLVAGGGLLPSGLWKVEVRGLDLSNSNFWRFEQVACGLINGAPVCPPDPYLIGDTVWLDLDESGTQDPGEDGIPGVVVNIFDSSGTVIGQRVTDADGMYFYDVVPGTYTVEVADENFAPVPTGAVGDRVWLDVDGDGAQDGGEPGLSNVTVRLVDCVSLVSKEATQTNADGFYWFDNLAADTYCTQVDESTLPSGLTLSGGTNPSVSRTITTDETFNDLDFGYTIDPTLAAIGDFVWLDDNGNGVREPEEAGIGGVTLSLEDCTDPGTSLALTKTGPDGSYFFGDLAPGCYTVVVIDAAGLVADLTLTTPLGPTQNINVAAGDVYLAADFGYQALAPAERYCISERVWYDADADGLYEPAPGGSDTPIAGVTATLTSGGGDVLASDVSDADGVIQFCGLRSTGYGVELTDMNSALAGLVGTTQAGLDYERLVVVAGADVVDESFGYIDQGALSGYSYTTANSITDTVVDANILTYDFGLVPPGSIGDYVWYDDNGDGVQDAGEPGIPGVRVVLYDGDGNFVADTTTDDDGFYSFTSLPPGDYNVMIDGTTLPSGVVQTFEQDGTLDGSTDVSIGFVGGLESDRDDIDFGYQRLGSIGDRVWEDLDGDGVQDPGEPGINGVTVQLVDPVTGDVIDTQVTSGDGNYTFSNLPTGDYTIVVVPDGLPSGSSQTFDLDGTLDHMTTISLMPGETRDDVDFGYRQVGSIGDRVWMDLDGDGVQDAAEPGINGVVVRLLDADGNEIATDTTGGDGSYLFETLPSGEYTVVIDTSTLPAGFFPTYDFDGTLDNQTTYILAPGENQLDLDFGYQDCGECKGKVSVLTMMYVGDTAGVVRVDGRRGGSTDVLFEGYLEPGDIFTVYGPAAGKKSFSGTLGTEITLYVEGALNTMIHTSCSQPIGPGLISGDFVVLSGSSKHGGALCSL